MSGMVLSCGKTKKVTSNDCKITIYLIPARAVDLRTIRRTDTKIRGVSFLYDIYYYLYFLSFSSFVFSVVWIRETLAKKRASKSTLGLQHYKGK